jgi:hypothetical protein
MAFLPEKHRSPAPLRRKREERSFNIWILVCVACGAFSGWLFWPMIKQALPGNFSSSLGHVFGMKLDPTLQDDVEDRRGEHQVRDSDLSKLGPPWGWPSGPQWDMPRGGPPFPETTGTAGPYQDRQGRPYRRWRDCLADTLWTKHVRCTPWQYGPAPGDR